MVQCSAPVAGGFCLAALVCRAAVVYSSWSLPPTSPRTHKHMCMGMTTAHNSTPLTPAACAWAAAVAAAVASAAAAAAVVPPLSLALSTQVNIGPGPQRDAAGASELLAALAHLTRLRCLELYETNLQAIEDAQQANHAAQLAANPHMGMLNHNINFHDQFSSLTASSRLENLALVYRDERVRRLPLPRHTDFDVIFRPGEELVHLAELVIDALDLNALEALADVDSGDDDSDGDFEGQRYDPYIDHGCMCCMDLKNIANCCPNLQHLTLSSVLACEHPQDMTVDYPCALRKLQRHLNLESLCLGGPWLSTASAAAVASMTTLQRLELYNAPNLRANGLEQLTTLRQLKWLEARGVGCVRQVDLCLMSTVRGLKHFPSNPLLDIVDTHAVFGYRFPRIG